MRQWLIGWLAEPLNPILQQAFKVLLAIENSLNDVLKTVTDLGVPTDTPIFNTIKTIITAVIAVKLAFQKAIEFLGGEVNTIQTETSTLNLEKELDQLKKLL